MSLWPRSLHGRLLVLLLSLTTTVWASAAAIDSFYSMRTLDGLLDRHLEQSAAVLVARQVGDVDDPPDVGSGASTEQPERVAYQVWHQDELAMRSANAPAEPMSTATGGFETRHFLGSDWRVYASSVGDEIRIYVGERTGVRDQILYTVVRSALWTLSVVLPLLAISAWWSVRRGLAPLRQLGQAIAGRRPQSLDEISLNQPMAELQPVVGALNELFERIANLLQSERRFTADAAHELRTPIAAIRAQAEVARGSSDAALRLRALEQTLAGCDRAKHLIGQLLTMARLDTEAAPMREPFDLSRTVREVAAQVAPRALARGQSLVLDAPASVTAGGDETLIGLLVRNLLDNAIRYSPEGATVRAAVDRRGDRTCLTVEDSGPGLTEEQRARLGERFYRVLGSDQSGSGLGWSIVRRIAQVHDLEIRTGSSPDLGGLLVGVCWPEAGASTPTTA
jgi:two-component system sensor histidine kinase QseC